jgi:glucosamine--fructose-6-phosphate aminotransferase (isomerizing)
VEAILPEVMIRQADTLAADLREQVTPVSQHLEHLLTLAEWRSAGTVYLTGDGDSYHAACAAAMAFETIAGRHCEPVSALPFTEYRAPWLRPDPQARPLVIAISASGGTERTVQALEAARSGGALTIAVTGTAGSSLTKAADRSVVISLPGLEPSPGIRTYQASLVGLLLTAIRMGEARQHCTRPHAQALRRDLAAQAENVAATADRARDRCRDVASIIADAPVVVMVGSGPSYGTALFSAAKLAEAAGIFSAGQDLEEWSHVERWTYPVDMPVFVIAPPGRSRPRALTVAAAAADQGRQVITVAPDDDEIASHARFVLPVRGRVREEFSPLLYHVFASYLASYSATQLGRRPFQA